MWRFSLLLTVIFVAFASGYTNPAGKIRLSAKLLQKYLSNAAKRVESRADTVAEVLLPGVLPGRNVVVTGGNITSENAGILGVQLNPNDQSLNVSLFFRALKVSLSAVISDGVESEFSINLNEVRSSMCIALTPQGDSYQLTTADCYVSVAKPTGYAAREQVEETDHYNIATGVIRHKWCSSQSQERLAKGIRNFLNPGQLKLPNYYLDLSLMPPTSIHERDLELTYKGSVSLWAESNISLSNPNPLPSIPTGLNVDDTSVDLQLSDFALNLVVRRFLENRNSQIIMKRRGFIPLNQQLTEFFTQLEQLYPGRRMELILAPKNFPKFWVTPTKIFAQFHISAVLMAPEINAEDRPVPHTIVVVIAEQICNLTMKAEFAGLIIGLDTLLNTTQISCDTYNIVTSLSNSTRLDFLETLDDLIQNEPKNFLSSWASQSGRLPKVILQEGAIVIHANADSICFFNRYWECPTY